MNKYLAIGVLGSAVLAGGLWASGAFAERGFGPNYSEERHAQMTEAFANKDYNAWKNLMGDRGATRKVTQENFPKFIEMHALEVAGKTDEAKKIREELGLGSGRGEGRGQGQGMHRGANKGGNFVDANGDGVCDRR